MTDLQLSTLQLVAHGQVNQRRFGYGAWRITGANPSVVGRLISAGLALWGKSDGEEAPCEITERGLAALAAAKGERV